MNSTTHADIRSHRGPCLLLVLCGLPATGKSSFASALANLGDAHTIFPPFPDEAPTQHQRRHVHHVCADALFAREVERRGAEACSVPAPSHVDVSVGGSDGFDRDAWQQSRTALRDETEALLARFAPNSSSDSSQNDGCHHHIIIVDDNTHLRSMVRPFMSLARQCTLE
jgi:hypothetical protein